MSKAQQGQALIETLLFLPTALAFLCIILSICYSIYAKEISAYHLYRALICTEEFEVNTKSCLRKAKKEIRRALFFHNNFNFQHSFDSYEKYIVLRANFFSFQTKYKKSIEVKSL